MLIVSVGTNHLVLTFRKAFNNHSETKFATILLLQGKQRFESTELLIESLKGDLVNSLNLLAESIFNFCINMLSKLQNVSVLTCRKLLRQKIRSSLVVKKTGQLKTVSEDKLQETSCLLVARSGLLAESSQWNLQNKPISGEMTSLEVVCVILSKNFFVTTPLAVSENLGGNISTVDVAFSTT